MLRIFTKIFAVAVAAFICAASSCDTQIVESNELGKADLSRHYTVRADAERCPGGSKYKSLNVSANFKSDAAYVHLRTPANILLNGKDLGKAARDKREQFNPGVIPAYSDHFECALDEVLLTFIDNQERKFTDTVDLRQIDLRLGEMATLQAGKNLEIVFENPSKTKILEYSVYFMAENQPGFDGSNSFDGKFAPAKADGKMPVLDLEARKIIIPPDCWKSIGNGNGIMRIRFLTEMPLADGAKGEVKYEYAETMNIVVNR